MTEAEVLELLEARGAVLFGHFRLSSGLHSDVFVQKFRVLEHPDVATRLGAALAAKFDAAFDVVAAPAVGAVVLGFCTALAAGARSMFAERVDGRMAFRRGFKVDPSERVLVVEDVITTGASAREVVGLVRASGAQPVGVGALADRSGGSADVGAELRALVRLPVDSFEAGACPLCARGEPLDDPGSRRI